MDEIEKDDNLVSLTADIAAAYVSNNQIGTSDIAGLITAVHSALGGIGAPAVPQVQAVEPAVSIKASVKPDYIVCLEDGKKLKMLKRYIASRYNMTPAEYRAKWGLKADYPMVAPNYSETRKVLALDSGLGRKSAAPKAETIAAPVAAKPRGRPKAVAAPATPEAPLPKRRTLKASFGDTKVAAIPTPKRRAKGKETASAELKPVAAGKIVQAAE
jgi:predicted transcriptional regulator